MSGPQTSSGGLSLLLAWALVGVPLAWGVAMTAAHVMQLFR